MAKKIPRGMGMFLIQALVDEAEWVRARTEKAATFGSSFASTKKRTNGSINAENEIVQTETKARIDQLTSPAGHPVTVLRFEGDIASTSKDAVLGTYQTLPNNGQAGAA